MEHLYAQLPDGTECDFGSQNAEIAKGMTQVERDNFVRSLVVTEIASKSKAGSVGQVNLRYEIRKEVAT